MTDESEQATLVDSDSVDIDVATDPEESMSVVTGMTVSAEEKVSTGQYESYTPYLSMRVRFSPPIDITDDEGRAEVRYRALQAHHDIQKDLSRATEQRLKDPSFEDWPGGMQDEDGDQPAEDTEVTFEGDTDD